MDYSSLILETDIFPFLSLYCEWNKTPLLAEKIPFLDVRCYASYCNYSASAP